MSKCGEKTEIYSRVTGYFRPVSNWNKGKKEEFKERKVFKVVVVFAAVLLLTGCSSTATKMTESASGKNLDLSGYVLLGELETANTETATPQGKMILGRVTYKSRKVGIPADQKVPNSGNFRSTQSKSLFGTEETIIEYDWTAGSDADAQKAEERLKAMSEEAKKSAAATKSTDQQQSSASAAETSQKSAAESVSSTTK